MQNNLQLKKIINRAISNNNDLHRGYLNINIDLFRTGNVFFGIKLYEGER